ncbi:MAG: multidrug effflux MFS transporter [Peptococcaceae bacterium]|nr:multidrug effflux MFS transporter [Peptococcaceae bacterium]
MGTKENVEKQKYLGKTGLVLFIAMMNMFIPLSTDLYLPALPSMSEIWGVPSTLTNLTLVAFFFFYAVGTLFWGPMSDKYGRKKILMTGAAIYTAASMTCALSLNVYMLIAARVVQGIGAGAITSVSMALIKDCFGGKQRETILAIVQTVAGLAPMLAPVVGAILLLFVDWRGSFWVLTGAGLVCLLLALLYQETLPEDEKFEGSVVGSIGRLFTVGRNVSFIVPCLIFSMYNLAFMGYISMSSYIYVDHFGLSEQVYSYFFAANAALSMLGPMLYVRFLSRANKKKFAFGCFSVYLICGLVIVTIGGLAPFLFWLGFAPFSLTGTTTRPFSTNILLDQQDGDTGSASSLINGVATVFGSAGMVLVSLFSNPVMGLGTIICTTGVVSLVGWTLLMKSALPLRGVK